MNKTIQTMILIIMIVALSAFFVACTTTGPTDPVDPVDPTEPDPDPDPDPILVPASDGKEDIVVEVGDYQEKSSFSPGQDIKAHTFSSEDELDTFLQSLGTSSNYYSGMAREESVLSSTSMAMSAPMADAGSSSDMKMVANSANLDFSETNNQVEGVDEGDSIKTDGNYIYTITDKTLFIVKAYPGEDAKVVSTITLKRGTPQGLFVNGDTLAVYGRVTEYDSFKGISTRNGLVFFDLYDISERDDPDLEKEFSFDGVTLDARMKGDIVYFLVRSSPYYGVGPILPYIIEDGAVTRMPYNHITYFNYPYSSAQFVTVHAIGMATEKLLDSKTVTVENGQEVYMSHNNIFITASKYISEYDIQKDITYDLVRPKLNSADKRFIKKIEQTDNDVLSRYEKENKIYWVISNYLNYLSSDEREDLQDDVDKLLKEELEKYEYFEYTVLTRISVDDGEIEVEANGEVPGRIVNQFSMDEYDGVFRIATTVNARWSRYTSERSLSTNHVFTLDEDLDILDSVDDLAEGERIYSTRFMGDKLYLVTFRQTDPFFVIDLSNPNNIKALGELKIPGFSRYLHPYSDDIIIGLGRDTTETGRQQGLKISLFDVSDPADPMELVSWTGDERWAQTTAEYEHKAFLFSKEKNLLVIPAFNYERSWTTDGGDGYNGAFVFSIDEDAIELRGLVDHSMSPQKYRWASAVERSLYIEDLLYTKSASLLRINELDDLSSVKNIDLKTATVAGIPVY